MARLLLVLLCTGIVVAAQESHPDLPFEMDSGDVTRSSRMRREAKPRGESEWLGLGVLSNMQQFFDSLRGNLDSLEALPEGEREGLLTDLSGGRENPGKGRYRGCRRRAAQRNARPTATAAYLNALRNHRPSHKIRSFVAMGEPADLRGANHYDPNWLWTGLGRR